VARKAYINDHDTVVFFEDDDERLEEFLDSGYREVSPEDRIITQAAEISQAGPDGNVTFGQLADMAADGDFQMDLRPDQAELVDYVREVRALRSRNDKARTKAGLDNPPATVVRRGKGR
jgi:hypothetical protein